MKIKSRANRTAALTLVEMLIVIVTIVLLALVVLPMMSGMQPRSPRINCVSNLKQVGLAFRMWSNDHGDKFPWQASTNQGGSMEFIPTGEVFRHFLAASNELSSPKMLTCHSDKKRKKVSDFAKLSNRNVSYFIGLGADEALQQSILAGDRNITGGVLTNRSVLLVSSNTAAWGADIHSHAGNLGLGDGSVKQVMDRDLRRQLSADQEARNTNVTWLVIP